MLRLLLLTFVALLLLDCTVIKGAKVAWQHGTAEHNSKTDPDILCKPELCPDGSKHVGCFPKRIMHPDCKKNNDTLSPVNGSLRGRILIRVNMLRNLVASGLTALSAAAHMPTMSWDRDLATMARLWLRQCNREAKFCANLDKYHYVATSELEGEVRRGRPLVDVLDKIVANWLDDVMGCRMDNDHRIVPSKEGACVGHYIPLVQDYGNHMGCGMRAYSSSVNRTQIFTLLCLFSRANVNNLPPYEIGEIPGEKCTAGKSQVYKSLCNLDEVVDANYVEDPNEATPGSKYRLRLTVLHLCVWPHILGFDYCDPVLCPGPEKHIACNNFGELAESCSPDAHIVRITPARRDMILNELNDYRDRIARGDLMGFSPATRMATLQWDQELASFAELNVKRCSLVNDHCRNSEQFRNVAQVVAEGGWQGAPNQQAGSQPVEYHSEDEVIKATLEQMFAEYKECSMRDIIAYSPPINRILHLRISKCIAYFTQLVRDSTTHVGCGILRQTRNTSTSAAGNAGQWVLSTHQYMTCNFVRGNDVNMPVYQSGDRPATECRTGRNPAFINLCSVNEFVSCEGPFAQALQSVLQSLAHDNAKHNKGYHQTGVGERTYESRRSAKTNEMAFVIIALVFAAIGLLYKWLVSKYQTFSERGVPHETPTVLLGNIKLKALLGLEPLLQSMIDQYLKFKSCKVYGVYNMRDPFFILRDAELIKKVGIKDFDHFANHRSVLSDSKEPLISRSLIALKDQKWREMRNTLTPSFTGIKMRAMYELINACSIEGVKYIGGELERSQELNTEGIELEMKDYFTRFANDVIASAAFGIKVNSFVQKENEFYTIGQSVTQFKGLAMVKAILYGIIPRIMTALRIRLFDQKKINYFNGLVFDAMKYRKEHNIIRPDMIHLLMEAKRQFEEQQRSSQNTGNGHQHAEFNDEDLLAQCLLFFFAGFETVSTCLCFATYELCMNPEVQSKLYTEISAVEQELQGKPLDYDTLTKMKYMDMVISESLRKWPPAIATDRLCSADIDLRDENNELVVKLKKDDLLFVPILAMHHDPENFPEPESFKPERFSDEQKHEIKPFTYLPFGVGPRNCIGNRFALMEVKSIIYHLVLNFNLVPAAKTVRDMLKNITGLRFQPKDKFWLKYVPRERT
ncbi:uncharacterized protein LOC115634698 [Scaptodrosophila lebanonensis]|uniref:Uncharacterized protein LOC115634698 n=1 Tax=Drosophila lebanonensis TaxID=7225 RepID=A0A6J2UJ65_DROLE|nr:uncharacterized protein LOC115634698 [Scaptodrosophila lebanonensis]